MSETTETSFDPGTLESVADYRHFQATGELPKAPVPAGEPVTDPVAGDAAASAGQEPSTEPDPEEVSAQEKDDASEAGKTLAKKRRSYQTRIDELTKARLEAERRAADLERRLQAAAQPRSEAKPEPVEATTPQTYTGIPKPSEDEVGTKYETYADYVDALTDWKLEEREARRAALAAETQAREQHETLARTYQEREAKARDKYADYTEVVGAASHIQITLPMRDFLADSDLGPEIVYFLAQPDNHEEARRIASLPPHRAIAALGKVEARLEAAHPSGPSSVAPPVSKAPEPPKPVGARSTGASTADPASINSIETYRKRRHEFL